MIEILTSDEMGEADRLTIAGGVLFGTVVAGLLILAAAVLTYVLRGPPPPEEHHEGQPAPPDASVHLALGNPSGATDDADKANDLLIRARAQNRSALASAKPFTEKVKKGEGVLWRARFAGLDAASAEQACRSLRRSGFSCFAARD